MKQYAKEGKALNEEDVKEKILNGTEIKEVARLINQGVLKVKPDRFDMLWANRTGVTTGDIKRYF